MKSGDSWNGLHESSTWGKARIELNYQAQRHELESGVTFIVDGHEQTISGDRLLEAAAFLIRAYCATNNIPVEVVKIETKRSDE